jgi:dTDP-4-dehydrorhamnose reductase
MELIATSRNGGDGLLPLDLADADACRAAVLTHRPDLVFNAGAYTAVDQAESEPELALAVNGGAPRAFAEALLEAGGRLLQVSTDFVFNGQQGSPYRTEQSRDPLGVYGATKATGEGAVEQLLAASGQGVILRTSWVMGPVGKNFALTMLRLHREREQIGELAEQVAAATAYRGEIIWDASKPDGTPKKQLDVSRLATLGWRARIPLAEGLERTVALYAQQRQTTASDHGVYQ